MTPSNTPYNPDPGAHPGLHALAIFELVKGLLAAAAATSLGLFGPAPIRRLIQDLITRFNLDPAHGTLPSLLKSISSNAVHIAVLVIALYATMRLLEAWGLWRAKAWASWLGCIGTAVYLPLDVYALYHHHGWQTWGVLIINLVVVAILARDLIRRRNRK